MKKYITSDFLKIFAMISMFIDHTACSIVNKYLSTVTDYETYMKITHLRDALVIIGRLAFPVFCYQLVQGFYNTRSRKKYAYNLLLFALLSEIPFDCFFYGQFFNLGYQNVIWTLLIGYLAIWTMEFIDKRINSVEWSVVGNILKSLAGIMYVLLANIMRTDYKGYGVLLIISIYLFYSNRECMCLFAPIIFIIAYYLINVMRRTEYAFFFGGVTNLTMDGILSSVILECYCIISFGLIYFDNHKRKMKGRAKYLGYAFYPLHLILLYMAKLLL